LYVGSASQYGWELRGRRASLISTWPSNRKAAVRDDIKELGLSPTGKFITLFETPFRDDRDEEIKRVSALVTLAKAVFTIWIGAFREPTRPEIAEMIPWEARAIRYHGLSGHSPFWRD